MSHIIHKTTRADSERCARAAYDAYCATRDWKSVNGDPLPQWPEVKEEIKKGWMAAAQAAISEFFKGCVE